MKVIETVNKKIIIVIWTVSSDTQPAPLLYTAATLHYGTAVTNDSSLAPSSAGA